MMARNYLLAHCPVLMFSLVTICPCGGCQSYREDIHWNDSVMFKHVSQTATNRCLNTLEKHDEHFFDGVVKRQMRTQASLLGRSKLASSQS